MKLIAINNCLIVRIHEMEEKKVGSMGLIIPTNNNRRDMQTGTIISVGPTAFLDYKKYYDLEVPDMLGKTVMYEVLPSVQMYFDCRTEEDGCCYRVIRDIDCMAIVEDLKR